MQCSNFNKKKKNGLILNNRLKIKKSIEGIKIKFSWKRFRNIKQLKSTVSLKIKKT